MMTLRTCVQPVGLSPALGRTMSVELQSALRATTCASTFFLTFDAFFAAEYACVECARIGGIGAGYPSITVRAVMGTKCVVAVLVFDATGRLAPAVGWPNAPVLSQKERYVRGEETYRRLCNVAM